MIQVKVSDEKIDPIALSSGIVAPAHCGASNSFQGIVRNLNHGRQVQAVSYDAYVPLAEKVLVDIANEAKAKWDSEGSIFIQHRTGKLMVGDTSVLIVVHTPHRDEAFQMCRYVIEQLKVRVPIWKKETYTDGETEWLKGHALCGHAPV